MELLLVAIGVAGCAVVLLPRLSATSLGPLESALISVLAAGLAAGVAVSWGLLIGLGLIGSGVVIAVAGVTAAMVTRRRGHLPGPPLSAAVAAVSTQRTLWAVVAVVSVAQIVLTLLTLGSVGDVGWDAGTYHLPTVGSMIQEDSLFGLPDTRAWTYYPALVEVQAAIVGAGLRSVAAASLTQLTYWLWLVWFTAAVLGSRTRTWVAIAGVAVVTSIPTLWLQARTLYVDVAFAAAFVAASAIIIIAWRERHRPSLYVAAALVGAMFGIKLGALPALPLVAAIAFVAIVVLRMRGAIIVVVLLGVVGGAPYMIRNAIEWSNATYPVSLTEPREPVDGYPGAPPYSLTEIAWYIDASQLPPSLRDDGAVSRVAQQYVTMPTRELAAIVGLAEPGLPGYTARYDSREGGFGFAWLLTAVLGLAVAAATRRRRDPADDASPAGDGLALPFTVLALAAVAVTAAAWFPRFTLGPEVLATVAALLQIDRHRRAAVAAVLIVAVAAVGLLRVELDGGYPAWTSCDATGCVPAAADREAIRELGLSGLTLGLRPLVEADVDSVALVHHNPNPGIPYFPAGLWAPDWDVRVGNVLVDSTPEPGACFDAYVAEAADLPWLQTWTAASDPEAEFDVLRFEDRGNDRVLMLRASPCEG